MKLVIFDFDGVLVETEHTTFAFYQELLPEYGITLRDEDFHLKAGRKSVDFFRDVLQEKFDQTLVDELVRLKREAFQNDVKKYLLVIPGSFDLLADCEREGLLMAIGSQNERDLLEAAVDAFGIRKYFRFIASLQDLQNKKPHPEVYLLAASKCGVSPSESVVIEDAAIGIQAAIAAGCGSIGVTTSFSRETLGKADRVIDAMTELDAAQLRNHIRIS